MATHGFANEKEMADLYEDTYSASVSNPTLWKDTWVLSMIPGKHSQTVKLSYNSLLDTIRIDDEDRKCYTAYLRFAGIRTITFSPGFLDRNKHLVQQRLFHTTINNDPTPVPFSFQPLSEHGFPLPITGNLGFKNLYFEVVLQEGNRWKLKNVLDLLVKKGFCEYADCIPRPVSTVARFAMDPKRVLIRAIYSGADCKTEYLTSLVEKTIADVNLTTRCWACNIGQELVEYRHEGPDMSGTLCPRLENYNRSAREKRSGVGTVLYDKDSNRISISSEEVSIPLIEIQGIAIRASSNIKRANETISRLSTALDSLQDRVSLLESLVGSSGRMNDSIGRSTAPHSGSQGKDKGKGKTYPKSEKPKPSKKGKPQGKGNTSSKNGKGKGKE